MGVNAACLADGSAVPHSYTLYCPPLRTSPRVARDFVRSVLRTLNLTAAMDAAALCTSELVTNTYLHAGNAGSLLWLAIVLPTVRITVYDNNPTEPSPAPPPTTNTAEDYNSWAPWRTSGAYARAHRSAWAASEEKASGSYWRRGESAGGLRLPSAGAEQRAETTLRDPPVRVPTSAPARRWDGSGSGNRNPIRCRYRSSANRPVS